MAATLRLANSNGQSLFNCIVRLHNGAGSLSRSFKSSSYINPAFSVESYRTSLLGSPTNILLPAQCLTKSYVPVRCANFFNRHSSNDLWKGVVSVSNQGAKKGRGRGAGMKKAKNLNKGQFIGSGKVNMVWPGLNAPILKAQELVKRQLLEPDTDRDRRLREIRDTMGQQKRRVLPPLERGWSGTKMGGRSIGPPDPVGEDAFDGFDTLVLEFKTVSIMTGNMGRRRKVSVFSVTGNKQGVVGFGLAKALKPRAAIRVSRNKAGQQLVYIDRHNDHTVMHDFFCQFGITKIFVKKMPEGYGLVCHRAIAAICRMVGIKDLYAKVEGSINVQSMTKAFLLGLIKQKSFQQLAEEKQLHLVELREENYNYPNVMASPSTVKGTKELNPNENFDFNIHVMDGRVPLVKKKRPPYYTFMPGWETYLKKYQFYRNKEEAKMQLIKEYGFVRSHLYDKYPECHGNFFKPKSAEQEDD